MGEINRYQGNTGRMKHIDERPSPPAPRYPEQPERAGKRDTRKNSSGALTDFLPGFIGELETEDIILMLILYLMYRESGDSELLIILGAMFLP